MQKFASLILRLGMAIVVIWFGIQQLTDPTLWTGYLPGWSTSLPMSATTLVLLNGWFECVFGLLLATGLYTRVAALLLSLHLYGIAGTLGIGAIGVRDFGLATGLLSAFFFGEDEWSLDRFFSKKILIPHDETRHHL